MTSRSIVQQLTAAPLAKPCDASWDEMRGDAKVRRCEQCARDVFAISEMTALEAEIRLLNSGDTAPCIRYSRDSSGRVRHLTPLRIGSHRPSPARALLMASAVGVALLPAPGFAHGTPPAVTSPSAAATSPAPADAARKQHPARHIKPPPLPPPPPKAPPPREVDTAGSPIPWQPVNVGAIALHSRTVRKVTIGGVVLRAPLTHYALPPGELVLDVQEADGKTRAIKLNIQRDKITTIDLDAPLSP